MLSNLYNILKTISVQIKKFAINIKGHTNLIKSINNKAYISYKLFNIETRNIYIEICTRVY